MDPKNSWILVLQIQPPHPSVESLVINVINLNSNACILNHCMGNIILNKDDVITVLVSIFKDIF